MCQQSRATVLICRVTMGYWKTCEGLQQQSAINNSMSQPGSGQPAIPSSGNRCFFDVCWAQFAPPFWVVLCRLLLFVTEMVMFLEKAPAPSSFGEDRPVSPVCRPSLVVDPCCLCCFYHNSACLHHFIRYAAFQAQPGDSFAWQKGWCNETPQPIPEMQMAHWKFCNRWYVMAGQRLLDIQHFKSKNGVSYWLHRHIIQIPVPLQHYISETSVFGCRFSNRRTPPSHVGLAKVAAIATCGTSCKTAAGHLCSAESPAEVARAFEEIPGNTAGGAQGHH